MPTTGDAQLVRHDRCLPGLATLLDADRFARVVQTLIPDTPLISMKNTYVRYKPGSSCLAVYRAQAGRASVDVCATAYQIDARDKLHKARAQHVVPGPLGLGGAVIDELALAIWFFPNDRGLGAIKRLTDDQARRKILRKALPDHPRLWDARLHTLRHKPLRRYVGQLLINHRPRAVLKVYSKWNYRTSLKIARAFASQERLRLAPKLGHSHRHRILAFEWLPGRLLLDALSDHEAGHGIVEAVGSTLARLHNQTIQGLAPLTRQTEAACLVEVASEIASVCPNLGRRVQALAHRVANIVAREPARHVPIHGDFYAKQVLINGNEVALIDLDDAALGDPAADLGTFMAHLEYLALRGDLCPDRIQPVSRALLEGYLATANHDPRPRIPFYETAALLRQAPQFYRYRQSGWPEKTESLLCRAEQVLAMDAAGGARPHHGDRSHRSPSTTQTADRVPVIDPVGVTADVKMPFLTRAVDPLEAQRQIDRSLQSLTGRRGRARLHGIRVTRHKPGRRCMIEYDVTLEALGSPPERICVVGKARARGLDQSTYGLVSSLWANGFGPDAADGVCVPEPMGVIPDFHMWLQRKVPGEPAARPLAGPGGVDLARRIAMAAHKLHRAGVPAPRRHTIEDEIDILKDRLSRVACAHPQWTDRLEKVLEACQRLGRTLSNDQTAGIHRDFYADQVLVEGRRLFLIDLDMYCQGDPALDVGNFLGHLTEQSLRTFNDPNTLSDRERAMADAFVVLAGEQSRPAVRAYATLTLVRHIYLSTQFAPRRALTGTLLQFSEERLCIDTPNRPVCLRDRRVLA